MAITKTIEWGEGDGSITLSYTGTGNGVVEITSDPNALPVSRSKTVTFTTVGTNPVVATLTIVQSESSDIFIVTNNGDYFVTSDGDSIIAEE